jgi:hypothetical protein
MYLAAGSTKGVGVFPDIWKTLISGSEADCARIWFAFPGLTKVEKPKK